MSPVVDRAVGSTAIEARRLAFQGLRAIAVLMVVAFHSDLGVPGGFTGVDVFFVISGFVITGSYARPRRDRAGQTRRVYVRRAKRLLPALACMLVVTAALGVLFIPVADPNTPAPWDRDRGGGVRGERLRLSILGLGTSTRAARSTLTCTLGRWRSRSSSTSSSRFCCSWDGGF